MRIPLVVLSFLLAPSLYADAGEHLIPAGSLISCTVSEPKLSSKTTAVGDPVLCKVGYSERYGRSVLPYNSYLVGRFEAYKDPGHFVGKGWMELRFDRMVIQPETVVPVDARVVDVPGYKVDREGRIRGKGHAVRDVVLWTIPILWPVDVLMLPARGPRPTLKGETRLTLKVMGDLVIPPTEGPATDPYGLIHRGETGAAAIPPPPEAPPAERQAYYEPPPQAPQPPPQPYYYYPVIYVPVVYSAPPPVYYGPMRVMPAPMPVPPPAAAPPPPVAYWYGPGYVPYQPRTAAWWPGYPPAYYSTR